MVEMEGVWGWGEGHTLTQFYLIRDFRLLLRKRHVHVSIIILSHN